MVSDYEDASESVIWETRPMLQPSIAANEVKQGWEKIQSIVKEGVALTPVRQGDSFIVENNFPKKADNRIIHIRPHTGKAYYQMVVV